MILEQEKVKSDNVNGTVQSSITESNSTNDWNQITHSKKWKTCWNKIGMWPILQTIGKLERRLELQLIVK